MSTVSGYTLHKSTYGRWRRKKGPAPARPVPVRRAVAPMSLARVRQELADIEVKQQGLERQGVKLEQTIREKFEQGWFLRFIYFKFHLTYLQQPKMSSTIPKNLGNAISLSGQIS